MLDDIGRSSEHWQRLLRLNAAVAVRSCLSCVIAARA